MMHRHDSVVERLLKRETVALIALVVISAFALLYTPVRGVLTDGLYSVAGKMWSIGDGAHSAWTSLVTNFRDKNALVVENDALHAEVLRMQAQVLDRNLLSEKIAKLEESLGRAQSDDRVIANVLAGGSQSVYDILVIDAGDDEGVSIGDIVSYANAGAIGEIVEVQSSSAKVKLYSSPGEQVAMLVGPHSVPVTALGKGMGNFEAKVPEDSALTVGDTALSVKRNVILGTISFVDEKPAEPFKRIFLRVPFNINEIGSVEVIIGKRSK